MESRASGIQYVSVCSVCINYKPCTECTSKKCDLSTILSLTAVSVSANLMK